MWIVGNLGRKVMSTKTQHGTICWDHSAKWRSSRSIPACRGVLALALDSNGIAPLAHAPARIPSPCIVHYLRPEEWRELVDVPNAKRISLPNVFGIFLKGNVSCLEVRVAQVIRTVPLLTRFIVTFFEKPGLTPRPKPIWAPICSGRA